jgi:hypothetical protein
MQAASNLHDQVSNAFLGEAQNIFDDATALDAGDDDPLRLIAADAPVSLSSVALHG